MRNRKSVWVRVCCVTALLTASAALAVFSSGCKTVNDDVLPTDKIVETGVPEHTDGNRPDETLIPGGTEEPGETDQGSTDAPVETQPAENNDTPTPAPTDMPTPDSTDTPTPAPTETPLQAELEYYYIKDTDSYAVIGSGNCTNQIIEIPAEHNGRPVTDVGLNYDWKASDDPDFFAKYCENIESKMDCWDVEYLAADLTAENVSAWIALQIYSSGQSILGMFENGVKVNTFSPDVTEIRVPDSVVSVHPYAFSGLSALGTVKLGNGVKYLSWQAFSDTGVSKIEVPGSVSKIDNNFCVVVADSDFSGISAWASRADSITGIESIVFTNYETFHYANRHNYQSLVSINVSGDNAVYKSDGNCLIEIDSGNLMAGCKTSVIPDYVKSIGFCAFFNVDAPFDSVPESVESVAAGAFYGSGIRSAKFGSAMKDIGEKAFYDCKSLEEVVIPGSVEMIGAYAFANCTGLRSLTIQPGTNTICEYAFKYCISLDSLVLPDGLSKLGDFAFANCGIKTIVIGEGIEKFNASVFFGDPVESVTFPASLKSFENYVPYYGDVIFPFESRTKLREIVLKEGCDLIIENKCLINKKTKTLLACLSGYNIPEWVEQIEVSAFLPLPKDEKIVIPVTVKAFGGEFSQNTGYYSPIMRDAYYEGTVAQFKQIVHEWRENQDHIDDCAITASVTCTDGTFKYVGYDSH